MPVWAFVPIILFSLVACPLSMWVMGKIMRRQARCPMCQVGASEEHHHSLDALLERRTAVEKEIAEVKVEVERDLRGERAIAKAGKG